MQYQILMRLRKTGNFYYFSHFDQDVSGKARGTMPLRSSRAAIFPCIRSAAEIVKDLDSVKYRVLIVRYRHDDHCEYLFRRNLVSEQRAMEHLKGVI